VITAGHSPTSLGSTRVIDGGPSPLVEPVARLLRRREPGERPADG